MACPTHVAGGAGFETAWKSMPLNDKVQQTVMEQCKQVDLFVIDRKSTLRDRLVAIPDNPKTTL